MSTKGFSSDKKRKALDGEAIQRYVTMQPAGEGRTGLDMLPKAVYEKLASLVPEAGSTTQTIILAGNTAQEGDLIRFTAGPLLGKEVTVLSSDGTTIELSHIFDSAVTPADVFSLHGYLTLTVAADGSLTTTAGPIQIMKGDNGVFTAQQIVKDDSDSNNTIAMPVEIVGADGVEINITAGDINVQTSHTGANPDSMRIGDGVTEWGIEVATKKGLVKDALVEAAVAAVGVRLPATIGIQADAGSLSVTQSTEDRAATVLRDADIGLIETATTASAASLVSVDGKLPLTLGSKADVASLAVTQSTEDKAIQAGISAKLPATLGRKAEASSLTVTQSTEDNAIQVAIRDAVLAASSAKTIIDQGDTPLLISGTIPKVSTVTPLVVIAATAAESVKVQTIEDIGEFLGLYETTGNTLLCALPVAGGIVDIVVPIGTSLGIKNMKDADIDMGANSVSFAINLIG